MARKEKADDDEDAAAALKYALIQLGNRGVNNLPPKKCWRGMCECGEAQSDVQCKIKSSMVLHA